MKKKKKSEMIELRGSFKVDLETPERRTAHVKMLQSLHFAIRHCKENGMEYADCIEIRGLNTKTQPEYDRDLTICNILREVVYAMYSKTNKKVQLREHCRLLSLR